MIENCKEQVTKHFNSVFDASTVGNLTGKVCLELKENATPYQAPVQRVPQALHKLSRVNCINMWTKMCYISWDQTKDLTG